MGNSVFTEQLKRNKELAVNKFENWLKSNFDYATKELLKDEKFFLTFLVVLRDSGAKIVMKVYIIEDTQRTRVSGYDQILKDIA
jgi:hypothetical protein